MHTLVQGNESKFVPDVIHPMHTIIRTLVSKPALRDHRFVLTLVNVPIVMNVSFLGGSFFPRYNDLTASLMLDSRLAASTARELLSARDAVVIVGLRLGTGEEDCPAGEDFFFFQTTAAAESSMTVSMAALRFFVFDLAGSRERRSSIAACMRSASSPEGLIVKTSDNCENLAAHWGQTLSCCRLAESLLLSSPLDGSLVEWFEPSIVRRPDCENTHPQGRMYAKGWVPFISFRFRGQMNWATSLDNRSMRVAFADLVVSLRALTS
jgi:hypothetical protein